MLALTDAGIEIASSSPSVQAQSIPGRDGELDTTLTDPTGAAYTGMRMLTLHLYTRGGEDDITATKVRLGALHGTQASVRWRQLPGEYVGRMSVGQWGDHWSDDRLYAAEVDITLSASPYLLGTLHTIPLTGGMQRVTVEGNRPAWPIWSLTPDPGTRTIAVDTHARRIMMRAAGGTLSGQAVIETDPDSRKATLNGNPHPLTLDSDYYPILPGTQTISLGGCTGKLTYRPRYFI